MKVHAQLHIESTMIPDCPYSFTCTWDGVSMFAFTFNIPIKQCDCGL